MERTKRITHAIAGVDFAGNLRRYQSFYSPDTDMRIVRAACGGDPRAWPCGREGQRHRTQLAFASVQGAHKSIAR
jgi:hypothetical protein